MNASERIAAVARAGQWLRHFHNAGPSKTVCLEHEHLANELDFARNFAGRHGTSCKAVSASFDRLEAAIPRLRGVKAEQSWLHGDFQPANVMMADGRTYGFDFAFSRTGFVLADAAHMFNDIERAATGPKGLHMRPHRKKMLAAFVGGYLNAAGEDDLRALAWFRALDNICFLARHYPYIRMSAHRWYFAVMQAALINGSLGEIAGQINFF
jgi:Ser/Thr protein kinase RdoA (MazF antagonist)